MVAVDAEDWEADVHVRVGVIHVTIFQVAVRKIDCKENITCVKFGLKSDYSTTGISNGQALAMAMASVPAIQKPHHSKSE